MSKPETKPRAKATRKQGTAKHTASPARKTGKEREAKLTERVLYAEDAFDGNDERSWMDW